MVCSTLEESWEDDPDDSIVARMRLNISPPEEYSGSSDLEVYETFIAGILRWLRLHGLLLIPKSELTPRSPSVPRSQPMSSYPLYSSLMFYHSQAPHQLQFLSLPCLAKMLTISTSQVIFPRAVTRQLCLIFQPWVS